MRMQKEEDSVAGSPLTRTAEVRGMEEMETMDKRGTEQAEEVALVQMAGLSVDTSSEGE